MSVALLSSASALAAHLPYFHLGSIDTGVVPIQAFGILVAAGVLIGASLLRRYAEWHGVSDDDIRGLTAWVTVSGFIGAHLFDVFAYQWDNLMTPGSAHYEGPILILKVWSGISSYGGFIGGAVGFAIYVWWKRLSPRLMADITIMGLLPAFSIGRIGCTVVSDHIGSMVDASKWYAGMAMDYPITYLTNNPHRIDYANTLGPITQLAADNHLVENAIKANQHVPEYVTAWNLGLIELLWLIPVNALILYLGFRSKKRINAGFLVVLTGVLYAPVRFFLDFLRPEETDPRYGGLTFAQWSSILAFGVAGYVAAQIAKTGKPAKTIAPTSGEAQDKLRVLLNDSDEDEVDDGKKKVAKSASSGGDKPKAKAKKPKVEGEAVKATAEADAKADKADDKAEKADAKAEKADAKADKADAKADKADDKTSKADGDAPMVAIPPTLGPDD